MSVLHEYAKIRQAIAKLEARKKELEDEVADELTQMEGTLKTKYGTIYTSNRVYWKYKPEVSQKITKLKNKITDIQSDAKENGLAEAEERISVGFRQKEEK